MKDTNTQRISSIPVRLLDHPIIRILTNEQKGYYFNVLLILADSPLTGIAESQLKELWHDGLDVLLATDMFSLQTTKNTTNMLYCKAFKEIASKKMTEYERRSTAAKKRYSKHPS